GAPSTHNFLFCRDFTAELASPQDYPPDSGVALTADRVIKAMITFELHGLMDSAYAHAETFAHLLSDRLHVEHAKKLPLAPPSEMRYSPETVRCMVLVNQLRMALLSSEAQAARSQGVVDDLRMALLSCEAQVARSRAVADDPPPRTVRSRLRRLLAAI